MTIHSRVLRRGEGWRDSLLEKPSCTSVDREAVQRTTDVNRRALKTNCDLLSHLTVLFQVGNYLF